ncbi:MAG TPA: M14 family metallopeptidase, partial [Blastocatellia bacterium]|nr:M14 family metallopeptidase [Blastocatellia bacterium]
KLAQESNRLKVTEMGRSAEGRPLHLAIITSPENQKRLGRYQEIARRLAQAEGLTDEQARALAREGRAVVWIDGGLHATEVLGAQQLIETIYQLVSLNDPETLRFLNEVIVLGCLVNPDGMELVSNWYMRRPDPASRSLAGLPRLYQKYIGHDNNRDFYLSSQPETEAINRIFYHEWFPQIVYNHHQTGPVGTVMFAPPFRDPFNYNLDPLAVIGIDLVGAAMHSRFLAEGKPGVTMRSGSNYSTWWNGGLRTAVYFHNMIGLLTETIGNPTPMEIPLVLGKQVPKGDYPFPIAPQKWHFRQSIDYSITANRAVLDIAAKHREDFLFNIYRMGKNSIERGSRDHWTLTPQLVAQAQAALAQERRQQTDRAMAGGGAGGGEAGDNPDRPAAERGQPLKFYESMRTPEKRDPRGYIVPADQPDFLTAIKFVNALIKNGVTVQVAKSAFTVGGRNYPAGSYVVKTAQAFRPHVLDMFEPQDHPNDFLYPDGPPIAPYDSAGWTLALQMGVKFDRILDGFDGPFEKLTGPARPAAGTITTAANPAGYLLSHQTNDSFIATNRLLKENEEVYWIKEPFKANQQSYAPGTIYIPAKASTEARLKRMAEELGLSFEATAAAPTGQGFKLRLPRIGLWDRYGGSMPSGWTRWLLERFEFPFTVVYPQTLDAGQLASKFDVLIFVNGAIPLRDARGRGPNELNPEEMPEEFRGWLGQVTLSRTVPELRTFLEAGGTILTIGSSTNLAYHAGLPLTNALVEKTADGSERPLPREKFYIPGSVLQARVDNTNPLAFGLPERVDFFFDGSPVFRLRPAGSLKQVTPVAWFDSAQSLRSGWAWGQKHLQDGISVVDAQVGSGKLLILGPEVTFRAQPHGTFKFLFNGIYYGPATVMNWP